MGRYRIGDEVVCVLDHGDDTWCPEFKLQVISLVTGDDYDNNRLLCYVPHYLTIKSSFKLNRYQQDGFEFDTKFVGEQGIFIDDEEVIRHLPALPGEVCSNCKILIQYASGTPYMCWSCRENPYR